MQSVAVPLTIGLGIGVAVTLALQRSHRYENTNAVEQRRDSLTRSLLEIQQAALARWPAFLAQYIEFRANAPHSTTPQEMTAALARVRLVPRALAGLTHVDLHTTLLETPLALPVGVAPMGFFRVLHADGELGAAAACAASGALFVYNCMYSTACIESVAALPPGPRWAHVYLLRDRSFVLYMLALIHRLGGFSAIVVTCDHPHDRVRDSTLPAFEAGASPAARAAMVFPNVDGYRRAHNLPPDASVGDNDEALTWADIAWLATQTTLPVVCKGVLSVTDAQQAVAHGARGLVVSNHGCRQTDGTPASLQVLPHIVRAVGASVPVLVDSGFRCGTDILKALALGARAVLVGRPVLYGLSLAGETGVLEVLATLRRELEYDMKATGCADVASISPAILYDETTGAGGADPLRIVLRV